MSLTRDSYYTDLWSRVINYLGDNEHIEPNILETFFRKSWLYQLNNESGIVLTDNVITQQIVMRSARLISDALVDILGLSYQPDITVDLEDRWLQKENPEPVLRPEDIDDFRSMSIQSDLTFDNFVVGDCNRESQTAALACAYNPGRYFNPLFIYGNSGLGKTHLLMAIANFVRKTDPGKKVYYIESLKFVEKVYKAIQKNQIDEFKQYLCSMDLLLVDDIQFLAGKEKSHEIFFSIYNELINNHKQICIASDRQPKEIKGLEDRLISRFSSGLSVGIDSPEFETAMAILRMKIENNGNDIDEVEEAGLTYIASNFAGNVRDLEGAWNRVLFYTIMFQEDKSCIKFDTIVKALKNQTPAVEKDGLNSGRIIKCVADYYGLTRNQIIGKTRTKNIANARHISIYLCRKLLDLPYIKIGEEFGGRDHSTIISSCIKVQNEIEKDRFFAEAVSELEKRLSS
ncbi:MAG: chromosomal replication initiator protein DnaA [Erysipelotrichaceae bacterium]|nr:chromosomal replication initiator protein DnaA [Erysipelotrichaceae bacterium]MBQ2688519.1 chromosomal replication initiator protein DnaA [Solobacterium sp.]